MKKIKQFRFYGPNHSLNYPAGLSKGDLVTSTFFNDYTPITQIGIQSLPGVKFYLNNEIDKQNPIILGYSGVYELNLEGIAEINTLCFDEASLSKIKPEYGGRLIIDIVYEGD